MATTEDYLFDLGNVLEDLQEHLDHWNLQVQSRNELGIERCMRHIDEVVEVLSLAHSCFVVDRVLSEDIRQQLVESLDGMLTVIRNCHVAANNVLSEIRLETRGTPGRPKIRIDEQQVHGLKSLNMSWKRIAELLGVSERTLRRKRHNFRTPCPTYSGCTDEELDNIIHRIVSDHPSAGERMLQGHLRSKGYFVKRWRVRKCLERVDPERSQRMCKRRIRRRAYSVSSPNSLWHLDGNHKLIRWRLVIHGGIDGFSRTITFLKCSANNKAETVHQCFMKAIRNFRMPLRIRTDHGTENIEVAKTMLEIRGVESKPVITGRSVHNQRIERLWVDVGYQVIHMFKDIFYLLENDHDMDPSDEIHLFALHYVYLPRIAKILEEFSQSWNNHPLRTARNQTPLQLWSTGFYQSVSSGSSLLQMTDAEIQNYGIDWDGPTPEIQTQNDVQVPEIKVDLTDEQLFFLEENFDPLRNDDNFGIDIFLEVLEYVENCLQN